jgi:hypothetical protein
VRFCEYLGDPVRLSGVGVPASASAISMAAWPARRSSMMRGPAAFLAGARVGPGRRFGKNPVLPARKSRTAERRLAVEYPLLEERKQRGRSR